MVDTVRTLAALQALLADNSDQDISPQDIRDFLVSVFPPQAFGASAYRSANQSVSTSTTTSIAFDTEVFDSDDMWEGVTNPSRITVNTAGLYLLVANVIYDNSDNSPSNRWVYLRKNGTDVLGYESGIQDATSDKGYSIVTADSADADDYYEIRVYQDSGSSLNYGDTDGGCQLSVIRLGQAAV